MFSKILNFNIFNGTKEELILHVTKLHKVHIVSGNPEVLENGLKNEVLYNNFMDECSVIIPDGVGTVVASKMVGEPVKEKIAGIEVMDSLIETLTKEEKGIYLLGTKEETLNKCISNLKIKYPKINIVGKHNGYFDIDNCEQILDDINNNHTYALFVAMGCPKQETFIINHMNDLKCSIFMGVGGSFDVIAGDVKRAPKWMIKLGLEWLYRVLKQPQRISRLAVIPKFLLKVKNNS